MSSPVYVAINVSREHERHVVGVATSRDIAREMVERVRKEPLAVDGCELLNYPTEGSPDVVGYAVEFTPDLMRGEDGGNG